MKKLILVFMVVLLGLSSCSSEGNSSNDVLLAQVTNAPTTLVSNVSLVQEIESEPSERIVIKNAFLSLIVSNSGEALNSINQMAQEAGGWVVTSQTSNSSDVSDLTSGSTTIRIPAEQFTKTLNQIRDLAINIEDETISGQDVTQEFTDLSSQLRNLAATEVQLQSIMDRADTIADILAVQNELSRVRGEIEVIEGRIQFIEESAAYSSITVNLRPENTSSRLSSNKWKPLDTAQDALDFLIVVLRLLADLLIIIVILVLPLFMILWIPFRLLYPFIKRQRWLKIPKSIQKKTEE